MTHWLGIVLITYGIIQLLLFEFSIRIKREFKPWWRDLDPAKDRFLAIALRLTTFVGSIVAIEFGLYLAEVGGIPWYARLPLYGLVGAFYLGRTYQPSSRRV